MKKKQRQYFTVFGIDINLNTVLTTIAGFISVSLISAALSWLHNINVVVSEMKQEQARLKKEYVPEVSKQIEKQ